MGTEDTTRREITTPDIEQLRLAIFSGGVAWTEHRLDEETSVLYSRGRVLGVVVERAVVKKQGDDYGRASYRAAPAGADRWETFDVADAQGRLLGAVTVDTASTSALVRELQAMVATQNNRIEQLAADIAALKKRNA